MHCIERKPHELSLLRQNGGLGAGVGSRVGAGARTGTTGAAPAAASAAEQVERVRLDQANASPTPDPFAEQSVSKRLLVLAERRKLVAMRVQEVLPPWDLFPVAAPRPASRNSGSWEDTAP